MPFNYSKPNIPADHRDKITEEEEEEEEEEAAQKEREISMDDKVKNIKKEENVEEEEEEEEDIDAILLKYSAQFNSGMWKMIMIMS